MGNHPYPNPNPHSINLSRLRAVLKLDTEVKGAWPDSQGSFPSNYAKRLFRGCSTSLILSRWPITPSCYGDDLARTKPHKLQDCSSYSAAEGFYCRPSSKDSHFRLTVVSHLWVTGKMLQKNTESVYGGVLKVGAFDIMNERLLESPFITTSCPNNCFTRANSNPYPRLPRRPIPALTKPVVQHRLKKTTRALFMEKLAPDSEYPLRSVESQRYGA